MNFTVWQVLCFCAQEVKVMTVPRNLFDKHSTQITTGTPGPKEREKQWPSIPVRFTHSYQKTHQLTKYDTIRTLH